MAIDYHLGYSIEYSPEREGYSVGYHSTLVYVAQSYDEAYDWIERQVRREQCGMALISYGDY